MNKYENVQVGDKFIVSYKGGDSLNAVSKVTATRFVCGHWTFLKSDGSQYGASSYHRAYLSVPTDEAIEKIRAMVRKNKIARFLNDFDFSKLELERLEKVQLALGRV